ncbi:toll/interleukin-1 receptor domain-containing protein [bacterium]|nr:toll/interleukin-1 receptor domain-containing protein [bacterium]
MTAAKPLRVFLSYGHDANEELVLRIHADLENRGHDVWIDKKEIRPGDDWRREITEGILNSHQVLSFLSKHSTRDPGVCRDEIAIALGVKGGNIQTILVESETDVQPPVNISHVQWLDMHDWKDGHGVVHIVKGEPAAGDTTWEEWYQTRFAEIVRVVESEPSVRFAGEIETLNGYLKPIQSEARIFELLRKGYVGREWLFEAIEQWRQDKAGKSRLFWIMGEPGVGKSAFAAQLTHTRGDTVIAAQFVEWDKPDHRSPERVVRSIAFQLATRLPDYRKLLLTLPEIAKLDGKNAADLFDYLLAHRLKSAIGGGRERYLVVIDALDEAGDHGRNPLAEMLARHVGRLPDWLGIVVTSRSEFDVKTPFQALNPIPFDTQSESNRTDLCYYLQQRLAPQLDNRSDADHLLDQIIDKSEGVFLYVERFCDDVQQDHLSLDHPDQFPQGLGGIYYQWFQRQFPDPEQFEQTIEPMLGAILAAREPLPIEVLQGLFGWREPELRKWLRILGSLFPVNDGSQGQVIRPYHKSFADWLTDAEKAGQFLVSRSEGCRLLACRGMSEFRQRAQTMPRYWVAHLADHLVEQQESDDLEELLCSFEFLREYSKYIGLSYTPGNEFAARVQQFLDTLIEQDRPADQKLEGLCAHITELAAGLDLWAVRYVGGPDPKAVCRNCGQAGIIHGHVDLGGVDYYDNYFAFCTNCFWAFFTEQYAMWGSEEAVWDFDYATNTYHWP